MEQQQDIPVSTGKLNIPDFMFWAKQCCYRLKGCLTFSVQVIRCATNNKNNLNIVINFSNDTFRPKYKTEAVKKRN